MVFMVFKDYKPEVPSHNSLESQLCGTLKNPHAICKQLWWNPAVGDLFENQVTAEILDLFFIFSFKKSNGNSQGLIRLSNNLYRRRCSKTKQIMRPYYVSLGAHEQELATPILSLCHDIFTDWSIFSTLFLLWKKASSGPVTLWRQLVSCDWLWHSHWSLIQRRFNLKINRSMKRPW